MAILLKKGDRGENVKTLQKALGITADGIFGSGTEAKVKDFQKKNKLTADGIVGAATQKALGISFETKTTSSSPSDIDIIVSPITQNITRRSRTIRYIVVHYTAGSSSKKGQAMAVRNLFQRSGRNASADFAVDDETIVQCNGNIKNYYCWAVGDGKGKYGITNSNSISIEMCSTLKKGSSVSKPNHTGWSLSEKVIDNTVKLVKYLMKKYNIDSDHVIRHYDASRKDCPGIVGWNEGNLYNEDGTSQKKKNNNSEWIKFKARIK